MDGEAKADPIALRISSSLALGWLLWKIETYIAEFSVVLFFFIILIFFHLHSCQWSHFYRGIKTFDLGIRRARWSYPYLRLFLIWLQVLDLNNCRDFVAKLSPNCRWIVGTKFFIWIPHFFILLLNNILFSFLFNFFKFISYLQIWVSHILKVCILFFEALYFFE